MKLDKTKIFTTVNADQIPIGTKCVFGFSIAKLEENLYNHKYGILDCIRDEEYANRFVSGDWDYSLAYIVDDNEDYMDRFENLHIGTKLIMKEEYNDGYAFLVIVTGYDRNTLRFYAAGKWYEAAELCMFEETDIV